jgi:hypothetical protein
VAAIRYILLASEAKTAKTCQGLMMPSDSDRRDGPAGEPSKNAAKDTRQGRRQDRLKLALRENLKRRKSQARGRSDVAPDGAPSSHHGDGSPYARSAKKPGE